MAWPAAMSDAAHKYACVAMAAVAVICASVLLGASVGKSLTQPAHRHARVMPLPAKSRRMRRRSSPILEAASAPHAGRNTSKISPVSSRHGCNHIYCEHERVETRPKLTKLPAAHEIATAVSVHDAVALGFRAPPVLIPQTLRSVPLRVEYTAASRPLPFERDSHLDIKRLEWEFDETHSFVDKQ